MNLADRALDLMTEPWCWPPDVVARLTLRQMDLIVRRQVERVKAQERKREGKDEAEPQSPAAVRESHVKALMACGMTREAAEKSFDEHGE